MFYSCVIYSYRMKSLCNCCWLPLLVSCLSCVSVFVCLFSCHPVSGCGIVGCLLSCLISALPVCCSCCWSFLWLLPCVCVCVCVYCVALSCCAILALSVILFLLPFFFDFTNFLPFVGISLHLYYLS